MTKKILLVVGILLLCNETSAQDKTSIQEENLWSASRPDGHAPISIMGDHYHKKREIMVSYRYMTMMMNGVMEGNQTLTKEDVFSRYQMSPESMTMNMHMLGLMYAVSDRVTLMLMANYNVLRMNSI